MSVHQCVYLYNNLHLVHEHAVRKISKYVANTSAYKDLPDGNWRLTTRRVVYKPNIEIGIEHYIDGNFAGVWAL